MDSTARRVLSSLEQHGLLLLHDKALASISLLVAGEPVAGSWWAHPAGGAIFKVSSWLDERDDVLVAKLVARKVTFIYKALWPAFLAMAESGEAWQTRGLDAAARRALDRVNAAGEIGGDALAKGKPAKVINALEERLVCHVKQVHSESGKHVRVLESWAHWRERVGFTGKLAVAEARASVERAALSLGAQRPRLPWDERGV